MPGARTHDIITVVTGVALAPLTYSTNLALGLDAQQSLQHAALLTGAHLLSGIMFSPDLDLDGAIDNRWGIFYWIWRPYMWLVPHRSRLLSHGLVIPPLLRLIYFYWVSVAVLIASTWALGRAGITVPYLHQQISDAVMGIVFSGMFGFGLVIFTKVETDQHLNHILFGNMLGVTSRDLVETALVVCVTLGIVLLKWRDFLLYCFDPLHARAIGLRVGALHYGLLVLLSLTIVASLKAVGIILVVAMLIAPGAIGFLLTNRFERMLLVAVGVAVGSSILGTLVSFHVDGATGPCIVLIQMAVFVLVFLFAPGSGILRRSTLATLGDVDANIR